MEIKEFNAIVSAVVNRPISKQLEENSATYFGMYKGQKAIVEFKDLGYFRYLTINNKTYMSTKFSEKVDEL